MSDGARSLTSLTAVADLAGPAFAAKLPSMPVTLESIRAARERIRGVIYHSPCPYSL